ncbi:ABC transporter substrate-binding protein [Streptomyces sp. MP131-18]|uniref:ABC transporter substrate-binding protein n=1 Tax=Streptomyces sp. MP131-18 TaxID=1857892 RepID=UPI0009D1A39E|nr:ABC transporter substrate-binding protein [Streptomyces sp. MP131-18]ONK14334.1 putative aliphatic sulfonates-binding protein precursor [Streptomyces sp. MP131-18]
MLTSRITGTLAVLTMAVPLAACAGAPDGGGDAGGDGNTVRIAHNTNAANLPVRIADEQGFFEDEGIEVEFTAVENISTLPPALGRSFEIVQTAPTNMIAASGQGIPMVAVCGATVDREQNPTAAVIGSQSAGITAIEDLEGKTLGVLNETGTLHTATKFWLQQADVPLDSVDIVQVDGPAMADQLSAGRVDAVETIEPFRSIALAEEDTVDLGDPYLQMAPEIGAVLWGAERDWAEENAETVEGFRSAIEAAIQFIQEDRETAETVLQDYTGLSDEIIAQTELPSYTSELRPEDLGVWLEVMREVEDFSGDVELADLIPAEG